MLVKDLTVVVRHDLTIVAVSQGKVLVSRPFVLESQKLFRRNGLNLLNDGPLDALSAWWSSQRAIILPVFVKVNRLEELSEAHLACCLPKLL